MTEMVPEFGGCLWPLDPACLSEEWEALSPSVAQRSHALASATLRRLTGYRVGACPITVRPSARRKACFVPFSVAPEWYFGSPFRPGISSDGQWLNGCGPYNCDDDYCFVSLPPPVGVVHSVKIDGVLVPETDYGLDGNRLMWLGGGDCPFPKTQDVTLPDTEPGTFSVTYINGYPVDSLGAYAAGVLAMEFAKACTRAKGCRLPSGVTSIVRQGVSMEIAAGTFTDGFTGIREVDAYIGLWNPKALTSQARVWSPDLSSQVRSLR